VPAVITGSAALTCLGDGPATFAALLRGDTGAGPLRCADSGRLSVTRGYHIDGSDEPLRASRWLTACVTAALAQAGVDAARRRVAVIVGTGLRELRAVEQLAVGQLEGDQVGGDQLGTAERLHFASAVRQAVPDAAEVVTISNACSAGGHALAIAQDLVELGEADVAVAAGTDAMTVSMLAMIGRMAEAPAERVRPFDADRAGVLLGEGAAALVVEPEPAAAPPLARLLSTGLSCDAGHETAPDAAGIGRAMTDALHRAETAAGEVDLVVAHGTGTALNDSVEAGVIAGVLAAAGPGPLITAVKGATGHTSGGSALLSADVAIRCMAAGLVPPIAGLRRVLAEGAGLRFVTGRPVRAAISVAQVNAFGFGGINAVTLLGAAP
jgi:3-oxoacyl-[acyl-carrier-protein] synthase II